MAKKKKKSYNLLANIDKPLLLVSIILFAIGLLSIVTASSREAVNTNLPMFYYFGRQLFMIGLGLFASLLIILRMPTKRYNKLIWPAYAVIFIILLYLLFEGTANRGALNWIRIFGISFQPSEIAKPIIIVALSLILENNNKKLMDKKEVPWDVIVMFAVAGLLMPAVIFLQKDLGTMLIIVGTVLTLFASSPLPQLTKFKSFAILIAVGLVGLTGMYMRQGYILSEAQKSRFNFYNPCSRYETGGYQICNGYIAINNGGLFGLGIGKSQQKYSYIPEPHTDSIFAIVAEELGLLFSSIILICYVIMLFRILKISSEAINLRGRYIALGVATYIFLHIFINLGGLFGAIPLTGVPLPFISYGGTFTISLVVSLTLVQRVAVEKKTAKIKIRS